MSQDLDLDNLRKLTAAGTALAQPTILALLDRVEAAERARDGLALERDKCNENNRELINQVVDANAQVQAAEAKLAPTYHETPAGRLDAWADTGDGYITRKGWTIKCIWCGHESHGDTKREALAGYDKHENWIRSRAALDGAE